MRAAADDVSRRVDEVARQLEGAASDSREASPVPRWTFRISDDAATGAYFTNAGTVVVGRAFVQRFALDDGELAMMLAHEMAHGLLGHRRKAPHDGGGDMDPAGELVESATAIAQEREADQRGLQLAHAAGWPFPRLLSFFDKLAAAEPAGTFSASHASAAVRAREAREFAQRLQGAEPPIKKPGSALTPPGQ